jgi:hypothetical protein
MIIATKAIRSGRSLRSSIGSVLHQLSHISMLVMTASPCLETLQHVASPIAVTVVTGRTAHEAFREHRGRNTLRAAIQRMAGGRSSAYAACRDPNPPYSGDCHSKLTLDRQASSRDDKAVDGVRLAIALAANVVKNGDVVPGVSRQDTRELALRVLRSQDQRNGEIRELIELNKLRRMKKRAADLTDFSPCPIRKGEPE